ncbi:thiamine biosynthesis protein ApbE [Gemella sp. oral taxon 928]|uniref:FAD:protein FMN transferase n=1 Tax=Gemella sp. oral taxon 928 TaxID=1785995 RepID=UPI000768123F|nr:FAD:protein FMN transferase [Gemella sp. oral taxon 928]AME08992.1 thiamine biosynthesis protein ApbE [Gemella sp. oral taxon 928]
MELKTRSIKLMGAAIDITIYDQEEVELILDETIELLKVYEHRFSANDDSSELMIVNHNAGIKPVKVKPELYELIKIGKKHSLANDSLLNIALGPIVQSWRIGFKDAKVPTDEEISKLLLLTDPNQIILNDEEQTVYLTRKGMAINLGALAKGYIADLLVKYLKQRGVNSGLINLGGNVLTFGNALHNPDYYWRIGIQDPVLSRGNHIFTIKIKNQSVVTSGIYERNYTENGNTYHHILNPKTGYPVETNVAGLTIISNLSVDGEIWTTRLFGKSVEKIMDKLHSLPDIEGVVVTTTGEVYYSDGLESSIVR